jgi:succinate dehydrogenase iron-sulfur subunit
MAVEEGEVVLDAVHLVQATQAGDLAVCWQMCMTRLSALPPRAVYGDTARTVPMIRDLVTDVSGNYRRAQQIPSFTPTGQPDTWRIPDGPGGCAAQSGVPKVH